MHMFCLIHLVCCAILWYTNDERMDLLLIPVVLKILIFKLYCNFVDHIKAVCRKI